MYYHWLDLDDDRFYSKVWRYLHRQFLASVLRAHNESNWIGFLKESCHKVDQ